jgi:hypothetical protein
MGRARKEVATAPPPRKELENPNRPIFGDPAWIERRGPIPDRKVRLRVKKRKSASNDYVDIWFLVEGEAVQHQCATCGSRRWHVVSRDGVTAVLVCGTGHQDECPDAFYFDRPKF